MAKRGRLICTWRTRVKGNLYFGQTGKDRGTIGEDRGRKVGKHLGKLGQETKVNRGSQGKVGEGTKSEKGKPWEDRGR